MNDTPTAPAPAAVPPQLDPLLVFTALASPHRWAIIKVCADGQCHCVSELSQKLGMKSNGIGKHLGILRDAGLLVLRTDDQCDGRCWWHQIPAAFRATPGVLDFGCCTVRL